MGNFTRLITLIFVLSVLMVTPTLGASAPVIYDVKSDYNAMTLTVIGQNLGSTSGTVTLGGTPLTVNSWSPSAIVAQIPQGTSPGSYSLVVTGPRRGDLSATAEVTIGELNIQGTYSFTGQASGLSLARRFQLSSLIPIVNGYVCFCNVQHDRALRPSVVTGTGTLSGQGYPPPLARSMYLGILGDSGSTNYTEQFTYTVGTDGIITIPGSLAHGDISHGAPYRPYVGGIPDHSHRYDLDG